jgi:hypothetical protein
LAGSRERFEFREYGGAYMDRILVPGLISALLLFLAAAGLMVGDRLRSLVESDAEFGAGPDEEDRAAVLAFPHDPPGNHPNSTRRDRLDGDLLDGDPLDDDPDDDDPDDAA